MTTNKEPVNTTTDWLMNLRIFNTAYHKASLDYERQHKMFGIPVVIITAIVGTTIFATMSQTENTWLKITTGIISVAATVLSSLQTFLNYSEKAEKCKTASLEYGDLARKLEIALTNEADYKKNEKDILTQINEKWSEIGKAAPRLPDRYTKQIAAAQQHELRARAHA